MPLTAFSGTERFELIRRIGEGGFGIVYEALDRKRSARVASRCCGKRKALPLPVQARVSALADISNENLVGSTSADDGHPGFTMELVNGVSLVDYAARSPGNPLTDAGAATAFDEDGVRRSTTRSR